MSLAHAFKTSAGLEDAAAVRSPHPRPDISEEDLFTLIVSRRPSATTAPLVKQAVPQRRRVAVAAAVGKKPGGVQKNTESRHRKYPKDTAVNCSQKQARSMVVLIS